MSEAEYLCDRIALMHAGRIIDEGPLPDLLARANQSNLTDAFLHHVNPRSTAAASSPLPRGSGETGA
jgi:sodium transport system ATP-binding protein